MRVDKAKKLGIVTEELLKNPLQTTRELEEKTGISKSTIASYINEDLDKLGQKSADVIKITDNDRKIIEDAQFINMFALQGIRKQIETGEITKVELRDAKQASEIAKESTARYTIFKGDITNKDGGMKNNIRDLSDDELLNLI